MSRRNTKSQAVVERLLDERRQYEEWLQKLAVPGAAGASSPVMERVRADYRSRLDNVTRQLAQHEGELETVLAEAEMRRDHAAAQRSARQEALAEAALRHAVGEYDEEKFAALNAEHASFLAQLAEDIDAARRDIARVEEILGLIARALPEQAAPAGGPDSPPAVTTLSADAEALGRVAAHIGGLDELSFLRSVAGGARGGPEPRPEPPPPPPHADRAPEARPVDLPQAERVPEARPVDLPQAERVPEARRVDLPLPAPVEHIVPEVPEAKPAARASKKGAGSAAEAADDVARKTLRCVECSTLNRPTEWYCEKCGAELSAF